MTTIGSTAPFNPPVLMLEQPQPGISSASSPDGFAEKLRSILHEANETPKAGDDAMQAYASGEQNDIHGTMIKVAQADISLRLVSNIRSRVVEAYREVMRMGG
jgi:flagellar hook-basal body complex protein FliE